METTILYTIIYISRAVCQVQNRNCKCSVVENENQFLQRGPDIIGIYSHRAKTIMPPYNILSFGCNLTMDWCSFHRISYFHH